MVANIEIKVYHIPTMDMRFIIEALKRSKGNKKEAADMLGINVRTLLRKRNQYNIPTKIN